jgi:hypothetical protein
LIDSHEHESGSVAIYLSHDCGLAVWRCGNVGLPLPAQPSQCAEYAPVAGGKVDDHQVRQGVDGLEAHVKQPATAASTDIGGTRYISQTLMYKR